MSDFDHDLYGDLDLEDLDATQLEEELVDPEAESGESVPVRPAPAPAAAPINAPAPIASNISTSDNNVAASSTTGGGGGYHDGGMQGNSHAYADNHGHNMHEEHVKPGDMPDEGKMFIGGLNWETTDDGLRSYFSQYGDIDQCTIMRDPTGRSRGFAFLTFRDSASVQQVLDKSHQLDGKMIDPKRAIPRAEHERTAKVFVGGLAPSVTSESLKRFLSQFGKVMDATVMFDRLNGRSKGFAFATFAEESGVDQAMAHSGIELEGRSIEIKKAQPRGAGTQVKSFNAPGGARTSGFNATSGSMGSGMMGFDPSAMAMMYQNMLKGAAGGNMMGGGGNVGGGGNGAFDPNTMAMMYQNMMKNMNMNQAPAINPNMNRVVGMGGMGMNNMMGMGMGMGNMMSMGAMNGMGMGGMGMGSNMGGMHGGGGGGSGGMGGGRGGRPPNAPRGPAAMRGGPSGMAQPMAQGGSGASGSGSGSGPQRYSTQGNARSKPY